MRASTIGQVGQSSEYDNFHSVNKHDLWSKPEKPRTIRKQKVGTVSRETIIHAKTAIQQAVQSDLIEFPIINNLQELEEIISTRDVIPAMCSMYSHPLMKKHLQHVTTPMLLIHEVLSNLEMKKHAKILCMFNVEWVAYLVKVLNYDVNNIYFIDDGVDIKDGTGKIVSIKSWVLVNTLGIPVENLIYHTEMEVKNMKFDYIVGNPPYDSLSALHQQFFVKAFGLLTDDGTIAFIQPANPYFNKKDTRKKKAELSMREIIKQHCIKVIFKNEDVFYNAQLGSKLAITYASPEKISNEMQVIYQNGVKETSDLAGVNQLTIPGNVYKAVRTKLDNLCAANGNFYDANKNKNGLCAKLPKVRGHAGQDDFNTFIPTKSERTHYTYGNHDFGIPLEDKSHLENFYDYLETDFARACLALVKMDINLTGGELRHIPMVDFSKKYSEDELFNMAGLNDEEREILIKLIPDYYGRRK